MNLLRWLCYRTEHAHDVSVNPVTGVIQGNGPCPPNLFIRVRYISSLAGPIRLIEVIRTTPRPWFRPLLHLWENR